MSRKENIYDPYSEKVIRNQTGLADVAKLSLDSEKLWWIEAQYFLNSKTKGIIKDLESTNLIQGNNLIVTGNTTVNNIDIVGDATETIINGFDNTNNLIWQLIMRNPWEQLIFRKASWAETILVP